MRHLLLCLMVLPALPSAAEDLLVYGGTPAGITAAIAAARQNASVVLIEPSQHLGGMITGGLSRTDIGKPDIIGGLALECFERIARHYDDPRKLTSSEKFYSEPRIAERAFNEMLKEAGVKVVLGERLDLNGGVTRDGNQITTIRCERGKTYMARVFIDATYEGDLMARAGVKYIVGRESRSKYHEPLAGYFPMPVRPRTPEVMASECPCVGGTGPHYIHGTPAKISALNDAGKPLFGVEQHPPAGLKPGDGDERTQSYNFRIIVTRDRANQAPFPKPAGYDPKRYELLLRMLKVYPDLRFTRLFHLGPVPGGKFDLNAAGLFSTDHPGFNSAYPNGDYATREKIWSEHVEHIQGLLWFCGHDERLPQRFRDEADAWGLAKDEFVDNGNWPYQLYVREGRRMVGQYVLVQKDLQQEITKPDSIAMGSFVIDCHIVRRIVDAEGNVTDEGSFIDAPAKLYAIPYRSLTPVKEQCVNLLVPVCLSASHIAYCSIRMEPQYMMMGHAAGVAAVMAIRGGKAVQDIDVAALQKTLVEQKQIVGRPADPNSPPASSFPGIVVDDEQATYTGEWVTSSHTGGIDGGYHHDGDAEKGRKSARFEVKLPADGRYEVRVAYSSFANRASSVPVTIACADGEKKLSFNQKLKPPIDGRFASLGVFPFTAKAGAVITISNTDTNGYVSVDAVQLLAVK